MWVVQHLRAAPHQGAGAGSLTLARLQENCAGLLSTMECQHLLVLPMLPGRFIDEGGHPDDFVRSTFRTAVSDNQVGGCAQSAHSARHPHSGDTCRLAECVHKLLLSGVCAQ
jgi:hypothetical protein